MERARTRNLEQDVSGTTYVATVDEPSLGGITSECLVLFLADGDEPQNCLLDPAVISLRPATGHWCLVYSDREIGRAFYSRFAQTDAGRCAVHGARYVDDAAH